MSGHSRWSQIKHKKAIADAKKGAVFGKLGRAISVAARGNPDPATNLRLKAEIERARAFNMPKENIERALSRVSDSDSAALTEVQLEFIGPGNAALIVSAITDNSNRTISELKHVASLHGGRMADPGSALWMFKKVGVLRLAPTSGEDMQLRAIDAGATDVAEDAEGTLVYTSPERFQAVKEALGAAVASSDIELVASVPLSVADDTLQRQLLALLEALDEHDDVQNVVTNAELT